jgi:hypothetical protein
LLTPLVELTGVFEETSSLIDIGGVMEAIEDARREHEEKLLRKAPVETAGGAELEPKKWNPRDSLSEPAMQRSGGQERGAGKGDGRQRPEVPRREQGKDGNRQKAPTPGRPQSATPAPKPAPVEPKPAPKIQWGRRPGR